MLGSTNGVVVPLGKLLIPDPSAAVAGSDDAAGTGGGEQKMIDVAENVANLNARLGFVAQKLQRLTNETVSSSAVTENKTGSLFDRLGANVDAMARLAETVEEHQTQHTAEVAQLSGTVHELSTNQTRHVAEVTRLSSTVEELKANQTRMEGTVKELSDYMALVLERILPKDNSDVPLECKVGAWSGWSACSNADSCGDGNRERSREVKKLGGRSDTVCPPATQSEACLSIPCPKDCVVEEIWTNWTECTPTCGDSSRQQRYRKVASPPSNSGKECGETAQSRSCNKPCPEGTCSGGVFTTVAELKVLDGCKTVEGSVELIQIDTAGGAASTIASYLSKLVTVTKSILLFGIDGLPSLTIFSNLVEVGEDFTIKQCTKFASLDGANKLERVGRNLNLIDVEVVPTFSGLTEVGGDVYVNTYASWVSADSRDSTPIKAFDNVLRVGGHVVMKAPYSSEIVAFGTLETVGGNVRLSSGNAPPGVTKIVAFGSVQTVDGGVFFDNFPFVVVMKVFGSATRFGGNPRVGTAADNLHIGQQPKGIGLHLDGIGGKADTAWSPIEGFEKLVYCGGGGGDQLYSIKVNNMFLKRPLFGSLETATGIIWLGPVKQKQAGAYFIGSSEDPWFPELKRAGGIFIYDYSNGNDAKDTWLDFNNAFKKLTECSFFVAKSMGSSMKLKKVHSATPAFPVLLDLPAASYPVFKMNINGRNPPIRGSFWMGNLNGCGEEADPGLCSNAGLEGWFPQLQHIGGYLRVEAVRSSLKNWPKTKLLGLQQLESVGGEIYFYSVDTLTSLSPGLNNLKRYDVF